MSDPSPIYKNPLHWWQNKLAELERIVQYKEEHGMPVPEETQQLLEVARRYVTEHVVNKLTTGDST